MDKSVSLIDSSLLLPTEQLSPGNMGLFSTYIPTIQKISTYMNNVQTAVRNYEQGYTSKIVLNPADMQTYIGSIRTVLVNMAGGYDTDGVTKITAQAINILPDLLMTLRNHQLYLCRLYGEYMDSQGQVVGPLDNITIESTTTGGVVV